jgi:hypothetical protein
MNLTIGTNLKENQMLEVVKNRSVVCVSVEVNGEKISVVFEDQIYKAKKDEEVFYEHGDYEVCKFVALGY